MDKALLLKHPHELNPSHVERFLDELSPESLVVEAERRKLLRQLFRGLTYSDRERAALVRDGWTAFVLQRAWRELLRRAPKMEQLVEPPYTRLKDMTEPQFDYWLRYVRQESLGGVAAPEFGELLAQVRRRVAAGYKARHGLGDQSTLDPDRLLFISVGIGQDSVAIIVLYVLGLLPAWVYRYRVYMVFADTGAEKEPTIRYGREILQPLMERYGHNLHWLDPGGKYSVADSGRVYPDIRTGYMTLSATPTIPAMNTPDCTTKYKQNLLRRFRDEKHREWCGDDATTGWPGGADLVLVGIAADEVGRAHMDLKRKHRVVYPLVGLSLGRDECRQVIAAAGLEVPIKSGCTCCPWAPVWERWWLSVKYPEDFAKDVEMEERCNQDRAARNLPPLFIAHDMNLPLPQAVQEWHRRNPTVTVEDVDRWLVERHYAVAHGMRKCAADQLSFDFSKVA